MIEFGIVSTDEEIVYNNNQCEMRINRGEPCRGTLLMTKSEICWKHEGTSPESGFMIPWEKITMQAITQEPARQIYFMIDIKWPEESNGNGAHDEIIDEEGGEDGEGSEGSVKDFTEFHIIPTSPEEVDMIYYVMSKFPETAPSGEDEDEDDFFWGGNLDEMNLDGNNDDRFADAD